MRHRRARARPGGCSAPLFGSRARLCRRGGRKGTGEGCGVLPHLDGEGELSQVDRRRACGLERDGGLAPGRMYFPRREGAALPRRMEGMGGVYRRRLFRGGDGRGGGGLFGGKYFFLKNGARGLQSGA